MLELKNYTPNFVVESSFSDKKSYKLDLDCDLLCSNTLKHQNVEPYQDL